MYINNLVHVTKMAAKPIYGKNIQKSSSLKQVDRDFKEIWHEASMAKVLQSIYKSVVILT